MRKQKQVNLDVTPWKCMPPPLLYSHICTQLMRPLASTNAKYIILQFADDY